MSKQIYIDSNGNEIQVSGTVNTADMMPMSASDSTKVSEAIGDLSSLTTSVTSSLVGAVNEVNDSFHPTAYSSTGLSYPSGVSLVCGGYFKMGNICIVNMRLTLSSSISGTLVQGLPLPLDVSNNMVAVTNNKLIDIGLLNNGYINAGTATSGTVILATVYLCQG